MKNRYVFLTIILCLSLASASAQRNRAYRSTNCVNNDKRYCQIDELNDEQKSQIQTEKINFLRDIQNERNQLGELHAKKRTIETTDPVDKKALTNVMKQINSINTSIQKKRIRHQQTVKSYLNDDQIVVFDNKPRGQRMNKGYRQGGKGQYRGECTNSRQQQFNNQGRKGGQFKGNRPQRNAGTMVPDELRETVRATHIELKQQQQPLQNKLNELNAQLKTATTGKTIDYKKVDKIIEQQSDIQYEMAKLRTDKMLEVRSQLSNEQKLWFDNHQMHQKRNKQFN